MSTQYKHQEAFAEQLTRKWLAGQREDVRAVIRKLKNKAQASYIAARIADNLDDEARPLFAEFLNPNQKT